MMIEDRKEQLVGTDNIPPLFISGYFSDCLAKGDRPDYGYPANHLPETTIDRMEIHTSFMISRKRQ